MGKINIRITYEVANWDKNYKKLIKVYEIIK